MIFNHSQDFLLKTSLKGSLLGLDVSKNVFGVSYSDDLQKIAFPCSIIKRTNFVKDLKQILSIYAEKNAVGIIIGLPLNNLGEKCPSTQRVLDTSKEILKHQDIPIFFQDERYSTLAVKTLTKSKSKKNLDDLAAAWILQSFLDRVI